jgi:hypothetical protein
MAGFITLSDGRAYAAANWAYDQTIEAIADVLAENDDSRPLADWLLDQRCAVKGSGLGSVDVRELAPRFQEIFLGAIPKAYEHAKNRGPSGWHDPEAWPSWMNRFQDLVKMLDSISRGEPPSQFNPHMKDVIPPSGLKKGPGW